MLSPLFFPQWFLPITIRLKSIRHILHLLCQYNWFLVLAFLEAVREIPTPNPLKDEKTQNAERLNGC